MYVRIPNTRIPSPTPQERTTKHRGVPNSTVTESPGAAERTKAHPAGAGPKKQRSTDRLLRGPEVGRCRGRQVREPREEALVHDERAPEDLS
ncbi:hypothetical protein DL765_002515 [Monosporascus sp. GIB2]|nr:hypothetical protein DL765_002515 [Monosporascus sp. GIB2]